MLSCRDEKHPTVQPLPMLAVIIGKKKMGGVIADTITCESSAHLALHAEGSRFGIVEKKKNGSRSRIFYGSSTNYKFFPGCVIVFRISPIRPPLTPRMDAT